MKYFVRSIKYFIYFIILGSILLAIMTLWTGGNFDVSTMFVEGMTSVWKILGLFALISAFYPALSYQKRSIAYSGSWQEAKPKVIAFMDSRKFKIETDTVQRLTFICKSPSSRLVKMYEDRITMDISQGTILIEGHRKELARIIFALEAELSEPKE